MKEAIRNIIVYILTLEARAVLKKYKPQIVVVTGSVGKTSTKDAAYAALKHHAFVRKSEKSYNSDIGVPLTILGVPNGWGNIVQWIKNILDGFLVLLVTTPSPRWLILEVSADRPGDISRALSWLKPDIVVATRFPEVPVHVEFYTSPEDVIKEELFPVTLLRTAGTFVLNSDDSHASKTDSREDVKRITYGFSKDADVRASHYRVLTNSGMPNGILFAISHGEEKLQVSLYGVVGQAQVYALLGGVAGAFAAGASLSNMKNLVDEYESPPGRMRLVAGTRGTVVIDDSYNASPVATEEALHTLKNLPVQKRRIAVLGDMLELGNYSAREHKRIGEIAKDSVDVLVTVGVRARQIKEGALALGMNEESIHSFENGSDSIDLLLSFIEHGDVILIKGSQSMRMERVVKALMKNQDAASKTLARQDPEWLARP